MDKRKYKSGAEKRKSKLENFERAKKLPKIDTFFNQQNAPGQSSSRLSSSKEFECPITNIQSPISNNQLILQNIPPTGTQVNNVGLEYELDYLEHISTPNIREKSTDIGHYKNKELSDDDKRFIISQPPNKPKGPYPKDPTQGNRCFSETYYSSVTKYDVVPRVWLCYSNVLDAAYCVPCWLFSSGNNQWRSGLRDWQHLSSRIVEHGNTLVHLQSCSIFELWKKNQTVDKELEEKARYEVSFWKQVLERLFRVTLVLAKNSLAFRGHREVLRNENVNGNFLTMVELLAQYDDVMKQVISMPSGSVRYLSKTIQNEIIQCFSKFALEKIISNINSAPFFSLMLDTTQDIAKKDQLSIIIRTVHIIRDLNNISRSFEIKENFLGFYELKDQSAQGMTEAILSILKDLNIPLSNCYGQGYDGANVMSGAYNGVQAKIKQIQPNADYLHCAAHNLNLVVNDAVLGCSEISAYFAVLQNLYSFFGLSIKRWDLLSSFTGESEITLKKLNPTRWSGRIQSILAVKLRYFDIFKALTEIELKSFKKDEIAEASSLKKRISNFEFIFITVFMFRVLNKINFASKTLQKTDIDLDQATTGLDRARTDISNFRDPQTYKNIKSEAIDMAIKWGISQSFHAKRQPKVKKHFDELSSDHRFENREEYFKVNVYNFVIDIICNQISRRFSAMFDIKQNFNFLEPSYLIKSSKVEIFQRCEKLTHTYSNVFTNCFANQFYMLLDLMKHDLKEGMSIRDLFEYIIKNYACMETDFSEVYTVFMLFFTLPVTVASLERSFSKLKILKNCIRSTTSEQRLRDLSILSVEYKIASNLDLTKLIDRFANAKVRKRAF